MVIGDVECLSGGYGEVWGDPYPFPVSTGHRVDRLGIGDGDRDVLADWVERGGVGSATGALADEQGPAADLEVVGKILCPGEGDWTSVVAGAEASVARSVGVTAGTSLYYFALVTKALVLSGGGSAGIAWEIGVAVDLHQARPLVCPR
jgi:hypothetical protein